MADFETKLRLLSERGEPVGAEKLIERIQDELALGPRVVVAKRREGVTMTKTSATGRSSRNRGVAWSVVAFAAVLVVGGMLYVTIADGDDSVSDTTTPIFIELGPGDLITLPSAPLSGRGQPAAVWTGSEMIVWGGSAGDSYVGDGAALNLANGTWRVIAPSPLSPRQASAAVWTGTEVIVWGGVVGDHSSWLLDGAAYNPVTDEWRLIPSSPSLGNGGHIRSMVWTGDEAVVFGGARVVAYDPATDSWRSLANPPSASYPAIWTGDSVVILDSSLMVRYDVAEERMSVADIGPSAELVGIPGPDGLVGAFVVLPSELGAPARLVDEAGGLIAELPAFPGDAALFGDLIGASGVWVGGEVIFWIWNGEFPYPNEQVWALNPYTHTWRQLPGALLDYDALVVAGDVLLKWTSISAGSGGNVGGHGGVAYRGMPESQG